jgi:WD40 repeat protein/serine/threonine protein kinase
VAEVDLSGRRLGEFVLRECLDEGGFGAVYRCEQPVLGREAVVKVLHQELRGGTIAIERFKREAQLASRLDHPYAAHVYAFGTEEEDGLRWIAMELVHGITLSDWLRDRGPMSLEQFVPFFERVAQVVQVAHERGIVHRDLKPSNIMVVESAGELLPKLLDFGVARLVGDVAMPVPQPGPSSAPAEDAPQPADPERTASLRPRRARAPSVGRGRLTPASAAIGSPPYMAPEQWTDALNVGPASDLYALGALAYEALTGKRPFFAKTAVEYRAAHQNAPVPAVGAGLPPALDQVFARALAKRPEDRFHGALELAAALRAVADARLVAQIRAAAKQWHERGRPTGLLWRDDALADLERWVGRAGATTPRTALTPTDFAFIDASRNAAAVELEARARRAVRVRRGAIAAGVAMVGVVIGVFQFRAAYETRLAQQQARTAQQVAEVAAITSEVEQGRAAVLHDDLVEARQHLAAAFRRGDHSAATSFMLARALQPLTAELARLTASSGRMWSAVFSPDGQQIVTTDDRAVQVWDAETYQRVLSLRHDDTVYDAWFSTDGARLVTAAGDGAVRIWNMATGSLVRELRLSGKSPRYYRAATSPDGRRIAAVDALGTVAAVWDTATGAVLAELRLDASEWPSIAFSADGRWLAATGGDDVRVFDAASWRRVVTIPGPQIGAVAWDPAGSRIATGSAVGDASIWAIPSGMRLNHLREIGEPVDAVAYSPDGRLMAAASRDGAEQVFDTRTGKLASQGNYLHGKILSIEFDSTSQLLVAAGATGTLAVADPASGMPITVLGGPSQQLRVAHFDPSSRRVVGASWDGTARVWDATSPYRRWTSRPIADGCGLVGGTEPDGRFLAVACQGHATRIWDTARDQLLAELPALAPPGADFAVAFPAVTATGDRAAIARGNAVEVYELPGGRLLRSIAHSAPVTAVAFDAARELVSGAADGSVLVTRGGQDPIALLPAPAGIDAVVFVPGGRVAVADTRGRVRLLDRGAVVAELDMPARTRMLRPSPDGHLLLIIPNYAGKVASPVLWDLERHVPVARLDGPQVWSARWVDGGHAILSAGGDGAARLWGADGVLRQTYRGGSRFLADASLTPDGSMVVGGGGDGLLRFWDTATERPLWTVPAHKMYIMGAHFQGSDLVTRGSGGEIARWHLPAPADVIESRKIAISGP